MLGLILIVIIKVILPSSIVIFSVSYYTDTLTEEKTEANLVFVFYLLFHDHWWQSERFILTNQN